LIRGGLTTFGSSQVETFHSIALEWATTTIPIAGTKEKNEKKLLI